MAVTTFFKIFGYVALFSVGFFYNDSSAQRTTLSTSTSALEISGNKKYSWIIPTIISDLSPLRRLDMREFGRLSNATKTAMLHNKELCERKTDKDLEKHLNFIVTPNDVSTFSGLDRWLWHQFTGAHF